MDTRRKFWLVLFGAVAGMIIIACSCSSLIPSTTPTVATLAPIATEAPLATSPAIGGESMPGLVGKWIDPDSSGGGTISTIAYTNGEYVVTSVVNTGRGANELTNSSWSNGVLTWEYCPSGMHCITQHTVSLSGDTLTVDWAWSDGGNSGTSPLHRQP
jgi:hypothetical protein